MEMSSKQVKELCSTGTSNRKIMTAAHMKFHRILYASYLLKVKYIINNLLINTSNF